MENLNNPNEKDGHQNIDNTKPRLSSKQIYAKHLNKLPNLLEQFMDDIDAIIINLAMGGELSEVDSVLDMGEEMVFMPDDFRNINDQNVKSLYQIYDLIEEKRASIININALKVDKWD